MGRSIEFNPVKTIYRKRFVRIDHAFPAHLAEEVRNILWKENDPSDFMEWRANWRSKDRALLMLFLYSDVGGKDAPTRIKVGSHLDIARVLKPEGERGVTLRQLVNIFPGSPQRDECWLRRR